MSARKRRQNAAHARESKSEGVGRLLSVIRSLLGHIVVMTCVDGSYFLGSAARKTLTVTSPIFPKNDQNFEISIFGKKS